MPALPPNAFKVVCAVARKSWGWNKESAMLSYSQLMALTGINSHNTLKKAVAEAIEQGFLTQSDCANTSVYAVVMVRKVSETDTFSPEEGVSVSDTKVSISDTPGCQKLTPFEAEKVSVSDTHINNSNKEISKQYYNDAHDDVAKMIADLTQHVKDRYRLTEQAKWEDAAFELIGREATNEQLAAFGEWWQVNGYYKGKPALKTLLAEWENFADGHVVEPKEDKMQLANDAWRVVCRTGRNRYAEAKQQLNGQWRYVECMGKWSDICGMTEDVFRIKFFEAMNRVMKNGKQDTTQSRR